jgi:hypothetical protein
MKLVSKLLTIIAATSAFSYSIDNTMVKRQVQASPQSTKQLPNTAQTQGGQEQGQAQGGVDKTTLKNCELGIREFSECLTISEKITSANIDKYCETFNKEKCQNIFKNGMVGAVPICADIPEVYKNNSQLKYNTLHYTFKLLCAKDENNKYCPLSNTYLSGGNKGFIDNGFNTAITDTCKSKKCTEEASAAFNILNNSKILDNLSEKQIKKIFSGGKEEVLTVLENLKSPTCTSQASNPLNGPNANNTSPAKPGNGITGGEIKPQEASNASTLSMFNTLSIILSLYFFFQLFYIKLI